MRLLLDTNVFLWAMDTPDRLGRDAARIEDPANDLLISAVTAWEIAIKHGLGKLRFAAPPHRWVPEAIRKIGATPVAIEHAHVLAVGALPTLHRDPFDRLLIAQALAMDATLVTSDETLAAYPVPTILV